MDRQVKGKKMREYLVVWKGYPPEYDTWEPEENLDNCPLILQEYFQSLAANSSASTNNKRSTPKATPKRRRKTTSGIDEHFKKMNQKKQQRSRSASVSSMASTTISSGQASGKKVILSKQQATELAAQDQQIFAAVFDSESVPQTNAAAAEEQANPFAELELEAALAAADTRSSQGSTATAAAGGDGYYSENLDDDESDVEPVVKPRRKLRRIDPDDEEYAPQAETVSVAATLVAAAPAPVKKTSVKTSKAPGKEPARRVASHNPYQEVHSTSAVSQLKFNKKPKVPPPVTSTPSTAQSQDKRLLHCNRLC